jgi:hypothetical protein
MCHVYKALWREAQSANYFSAFWGASGPQCLPYKLNASDDSGGELYKAEGPKRTLTGVVRADDHCKQQPCNEPADRKAWRGKYSRDRARIWRGWDNNVVGGVEDNKANEMVAILHWQKFNEGMPAGLPEGTPSGPQDRGDHKNSSRCSDRVCEATIHFGNSGARAGGEEIQRPVDGGVSKILYEAVK